MQTKPQSLRQVDGVLLLDKPPGITSNAALMRAKRLFAARRAGHTGSLDPMATGLLAICLGEATKFAGELLGTNKSYLAKVKLGVRTATADSEGEVLERRPVEVTRDRLLAALGRFRGELEQVPPMYSALKHQGRPLYDYARKGQTIVRSPRRISVYSLELTEFEGGVATLAVSCSKGTYIRTLAEDLGDALGCGGHLCGLIRTEIGPFRLERAHALEEIEQLDPRQRESLLLPPDSLLQGIPAITLQPGVQGRFLQGQAVTGEYASAARLRVYGSGGNLLGLGEADGRGMLRPTRVLQSGQANAPQAIPCGKPCGRR